jgi:hypothetical protein
VFLVPLNEPHHSRDGLDHIITNNKPVKSNYTWHFGRGRVIVEGFKLFNG